jgi:hypothetical protein
MGKCVHLLKPNGVVRVANRDFDLSVQGRTVLVSQATYDACQRLNIKTVEALISSAEAFPSSLASAMGWSIQELQSALAAARQRLTGVVDETYLTIQAHPQLTFGAVSRLVNKARKDDPQADDQSSAQ